MSKKRRARPRLVKEASTGLVVTKEPKVSRSMTSEQVYVIEKDDPMVKLHNSAPASFTPPEELSDAAQNALHPLPPPKGYATWLDYAVINMSTRELDLDHMWGNQPQWPEDVERSDFEAAAEAELAEVRRTSAAVAAVTSKAWDPYKEGRRLVKKMKRQEGGAIRLELAAKRLDVSVTDLINRVHAKKVVVWTDETGRCHFPKWQFKGHGMLRGVVACLEILDTHDYWAVMRFFLSPSEQAGDITPLQLIRDGRIKAAKEVARAARAHPFEFEPAGQALLGSSAKRPSAFRELNSRYAKSEYGVTPAELKSAKARMNRETAKARKNGSLKTVRSVEDLR